MFFDGKDCIFNFLLGLKIPRRGSRNWLQEIQVTKASPENCKAVIDR